MIHRLILLFAFCLFQPFAQAAAEETVIVVRALAKDAKFIGSGMSGMDVKITDAETGEILARGVTRGGTGDTNKIIRSPHKRYEALASGSAAAYRTSLDISEPTRITVTVSGPRSQLQTRAMASSTRWVLPGKHIESGDGWLIEVPGFAVDILSPAAYAQRNKNESPVTLTASIMMLCGCAVAPDTLWDSNEMELMAHVSRDGEQLPPIPMEYAGQPSHFSVALPTEQPGLYEVTVSAYDARTGNAGVDSTSFVVQ